MGGPRGTTNTNVRGSSTSRRIRKLWLLDTFGDGYTAPCVYCGIEVDYHTITVDRWPILGNQGGRYLRGNIRPACAFCNSSEGSRERWSRARLTAGQST